MHARTGQLKAKVQKAGSPCLLLLLLYAYESSSSSTYRACDNFFSRRKEDAARARDPDQSLPFCFSPLLPFPRPFSMLATCRLLLAAAPFLSPALP